MTFPRALACAYSRVLSFCFPPYACPELLLPLFACAGAAIFTGLMGKELKACCDSLEPANVFIGVNIHRVGFSISWQLWPQLIGATKSPAIDCRRSAHVFNLPGT